MSNQEQMSQDDIYVELKACMVDIGYMASDLSEVDGWNPQHQAAWESFAYHKLGLQDYRTVPTSAAQLESIAATLKSLEGSVDEESEEDTDSDSTSTEQPVASNENQPQAPSTDTTGGNADGTGSTSDPDAGTGSEGTDDSGEADADGDVDLDPDFDENA